MSRIEQLLRILEVRLRAAGAPWALVGGLAVAVRAEPRFTRDVDVAVAVPDDRAAEAVVHRLQAQGLRALATVEHDARGRLASVRLALAEEPDQGIVADLLFASSGIEAEVVKEAEELEVIPGVRVKVARAGHLIALKLLARDDVRRPQDLVDLVNLLRRVAPEERERARRAVEQIEQRGFNRGRDLCRALDEMVASLRHQQGLEDA